MQRIEEICAMLRRWPRNVLPDHRALARECAELCRQLFDAQRVLIVFEQGDEPWSTVVRADVSGFHWREEERVDIESAVAPQLADFTFITRERQPDRALIEIAGRDGTVSVKDPFHPVILEEVGPETVLSTPVVSENIAGRMFVVAPVSASHADLAVAEAVGVIVATRFEATLHVQNAVREAVDQDRIRVARDLHDGLLQSFTGVVLQLETIHSTLENDPELARRKITDAQGTIMADQRELRRFVEQLRPRPMRREQVFDFHARLADLRARFANQWGIHIDIDVDRTNPLVATLLGEETFRLIHEAVTNSAKHGRASDVRVGVRTAGSDMQIEVTDNGTGFPFHGRMTLEQMRDGGMGPMVLAERVHSLNGNLTVDSTESGATVTISVPLGWGGA